MKLVFFDDYKLGVLNKDETRVIDMTLTLEEIPHVGPGDYMCRLIEKWSGYKSRLQTNMLDMPGIPLEDVQLRAPIPKPGKILCMAANYLENGTLKEARPINGFLKNPSAVIGNGDTIELPPESVDIFHHEAELGLVIGKKARNISEAEAYSYVFGYTNFIDVSARGLGPKGADVFLQGKSYHTFAPMGPYLVTADEVPNPQDTNVKLWVNGGLNQDYSTSDMGHSIPKTLAWLSSITTLNPGDIVALGTNHQGLGSLQDGDVVERETPGLGRLTVHVSEPLKREWPRGVDHAMADRMRG